MIRLTLAYDGTQYLGWQKTKEGPSIQESLARALLQITQENILPEAASRTDRGVHAEGQVVAFPLKKLWQPRRLLKALNASLPPDIRVKSVEHAPVDFHPTLEAKEKEYHYRLCLRDVQMPMHQAHSWHIYLPLDIERMRKASRELLGTRDFSAFAGEREQNPICTLSSVEFLKIGDDRLQIVLRGNRFLYKMARNIVGTLVYIGIGKLPPDCIPEILASRDRKKRGVTAPAHGLFLHRVIYDLK